MKIAMQQQRCCKYNLCIKLYVIKCKRGQCCKKVQAAHYMTACDSFLH